VAAERSGWWEKQAGDERPTPRAINGASPTGRDADWQTNNQDVRQAAPATRRTHPMLPPPQLPIRCAAPPLRSPVAHSSPSARLSTRFCSSRPRMLSSNSVTDSRIDASSVSIALILPCASLGRTGQAVDMNTTSHTSAHSTVHSNVSVARKTHTCNDRPAAWLLASPRLHRPKRLPLPGTVACRASTT